jgi:hypothetical protein
MVENGKITPFGIWSQRYRETVKKIWGENSTQEQMKTRYGILSRMTTLHKGDLVVVPRMPGNEEFTIAQVTTGYEFDDRHFHPPTVAPVKHDFAHVVNVDRTNLATYSYGSSPKTRSIASKFRNYRSAVNNVRNDEYANAIIQLFDEAQKHSADK